MVVVGCFENLAPIYQNIRQHIPQVGDPNLTRTLLLSFISQKPSCNLIPLWNFLQETEQFGMFHIPFINQMHSI
jgi:hypothetical protein